MVPKITRKSYLQLSDSLNDYLYYGPLDGAFNNSIQLSVGQSSLFPISILVLVRPPSKFNWDPEVDTTCELPSFSSLHSRRMIYEGGAKFLPLILTAVSIRQIPCIWEGVGTNGTSESLIGGALQSSSAPPQKHIFFRFPLLSQGCLATSGLSLLSEVKLCWRLLCCFFAGLDFG